MNYSGIRDILNNQLLTVVESIDLQTENDLRTPQSRDFFRSTLLPSQTQTWSIGQTGQVRVNGLFQIDVFVKVNTGIQAIEEKVDTILSVYDPKAAALTDGTTYVHIDNRWALTGSVLQNFFRVPIIIQWSSYQN